METNSETRRSRARVCDLALHPVRAEPYAHVVCEEFIEPEHYRKLCRTFPVCPPGISPTGFSLYRDDDDYQRLLDAQPAWRALYDTFHSQAFIEWGAAQFADVWSREGCAIDPKAARYVPYCEERTDKERATLRRVRHAPDELWVRMDIHQGHVGYFLKEHVDYARRLVSMLIYFCDHDASRMVGGELLLHGRPPIRIAPRHNLMVAFPCSKSSLHSVAKLASTTTPRNYLHVFISSSVEIWPRDPAPPLWRRTLSSLERRLAEVRQRPRR